MIKLLGCMMMVGASVFIGLNYIRNLRVRVNGLRAMIEFLSTVRIKISYELSALPELIRELREKSSYPVSDFLDECIIHLDGGSDLKDAWRLAVNKFSKQMNLSKSDISILNEFSAGLGDSDLSGQIANIQLYTEMLEKNLLESENILKEKSKVTLSCSLFGSLIILVLLI